jgi:hypothetical protein
MQARKKSEPRKNPPIKMGHILPRGFFRNPLKGGTRVAAAGVSTMKKGGVGVYFKVRF